MGSNMGPGSLGPYHIRGRHIECRPLIGPGRRRPAPLSAAQHSPSGGSPSWRVGRQASTSRGRGLALAPPPPGGHRAQQPPPPRWCPPAPWPRHRFFAEVIVVVASLRSPLFGSFQAIASSKLPVPPVWLPSPTWEGKEDALAPISLACGPLQHAPNVAVAYIEVEATLELEEISPLPQAWHFAFKKSPFPCFSP